MANQDGSVPVVQASQVPVNSGGEPQGAYNSNQQYAQQNSHTYPQGQPQAMEMDRDGDRKNQGVMGFCAGVLTCIICFPLLFLPKYCHDHHVFQRIFGNISSTLGTWYRPWTWGKDDNKSDFTQDEERPNYNQKKDDNQYTPPLPPSPPSPQHDHHHHKHPSPPPSPPHHDHHHHHHHHDSPGRGRGRGRGRGHHRPGRGHHSPDRGSPGRG